MLVPDRLRHDLRFAPRQLRKTPAFTITAILILALGLGTSIAVFASVDAALLKPLPHREPAPIAGKTGTQGRYSCYHQSLPLVAIGALLLRLRRGASHVTTPRIP
jgi:hypothetical protein